MTATRLASPTRTWTSAGDVLFDATVSSAAGHNYTTRDDIEAAIADLEWRDLHGSLPAMPALAVRSLIDELDLRSPVAVAIGDVACYSNNQPGVLSYGLYGIRNRYANGAADVFVVDRGSDLLVVCSDHPVAA